MLRLPPCRVEQPASLGEALALLAEHGDEARPIAGGTDLLVNMKHEITTPGVLVGLWRLHGLRGVREVGGELRIGALTTLDALAHDPVARRAIPSLTDAVGQVAGPQLRRMGTIGGNVCLDTRCVYINQTYFWRQALGFCLKRDGTVCHVVRKGRRCVAAASNDSGPVLLTLGARLVLERATGRRELPVADFYVADGVYNQARDADELLTEIVVPRPKPGTLMGYAKLRTRAAIDFPELGVAVLARLREPKIIEHLEVAVTALAARPVRLRLDPADYAGRPLNDDTIDQVAALAYRRCKPLTNIISDPAYRRDMVPVFVRRAFRSAVDRGACP